MQDLEFLLVDEAHSRMIQLSVSLMMMPMWAHCLFHLVSRRSYLTSNVRLHHHNQQQSFLHNIGDLVDY
jgi:hypothetical protein